MSSLRSLDSALRHRRSRLAEAFLPLVPGHWLIIGMVFSIAVDVLLLRGAHMRIDLSSVSIGYALWAAAAASLCYALRSPTNRGARIVRDLTEGVSLFAGVSLLGAIASYPVAAQSHGFVDPALERIDLAMHFNWLRWYDVIAAHPELQRLERMAYMSIFATPALLLAYFAWTGQRAESRLFIARFWVAALITLILFPFLPAVGPLAYLAHGHIPYMPLSALYQAQVIFALRDHAIQDVDLGTLHGLVCAPSFHAASAVLYIATGWRVRPLRWPIAGLNTAMLLATPVEGTHYLIDLVAGSAVSILVLCGTALLIRAQQTGRGGLFASPGAILPIAAE